MTVAIARGLGYGAFDAPLRVDVGCRPDSLAVADVDADGLPDLLVSDVRDDVVHLVRGTAGGAFAQPVPYSVGSSPYHLFVGDFDGDDPRDVAVRTTDYAGTVLQVSALLQRCLP